MKNQKLTQAKINAYDEFYTQRKTIEKELKYYTEQFNNKVIYLNCDNPLKSKFWQYFYDNFHNFKLKELISSHYCENGSFSMSYDGEFEKVKNLKNGSFNDIECLELLERANIIITNPPFSKFREFLRILLVMNKDFLILGQVNMLSTKETFKHYEMGLFKLGYNFNLNTPFDTPFKKEVAIGGICWMTTLKTQENIKEINFIEYDEQRYRKYDNYDAININSIREIPKDYKGKMGVPITYLKYHNPNEYKIVGADFELTNHRFTIDNKKMYMRVVIEKIS